MTDNIERLSADDLQTQACRLRCEADQLMMESCMKDVAARRLEERLERLGLKSPYAGSLERERTAFRLLDEAGIYVRVVRR